MQTNIKLEVADFLGFVDMNGVDAITSDAVEKLESIIARCNDAQRDGESLVADAIYDRLMEILRSVAPESELAKNIWEESVDEVDDTDKVYEANPMYSIQTCKSFDCDELKAFVERLPEQNFDAHVSIKLNGHGIRLKYKYGKFFQARTRARHSAGKDITPQLAVILKNAGVDFIEDLEDMDFCEIRGELLLPLDNMNAARQYNPDIKSAFTGVSSMVRASASEEEWSLLRFVAYEFLAEDYNFQSKSEEYEYLEELGFEVPIYTVVEDLNKATLLADIESSIVPDCEEWVDDYPYYSDGIVFSIDDKELFRSLGDNGSNYKFGNCALKVGFWKQDMYSGYIQTIMWMKGKTKLTPVAIVAEDDDMAEFADYGDHPYVFSQKEITNYSKLGVVTASGNSVKRVPLYEPSNMIALDAYQHQIIHFRYGGEAGVVPCFDDGTPLLDGKVQQLLNGEDLYDEYDSYNS